MENKEVIVGIDLGTTNSEVACIQDGRIVVIPVDGSPIVPSVVSLDAEQQILVGRAAVHHELAAPENTLRCVKRKMGSDETLKIGEAFYTPQMISSLILKKLKLAAEDYLKCPVTKAVITVPAFFNEKQREATHEAALLAGLEPVRLLNEPTAAALAYSLGQEKNERCIVYDLGGGTFDVSIVNLSGSLMDVKASHGDTLLGGSDFDRLIADRMREAFLLDHRIDLASDKLAWTRVLRAAESAKIKLSQEPSVKVIEEFITSENGKPLHLNFELTRHQFEEWIRGALLRTLVSVKASLEMANMTSEQIDRVILVGGATYTPLVSELLEKELQIVPQAWIDPSTVVAMGAAVEAAQLAGEQIGPVMVDITPHSLGTSCLNEEGFLENYILIHRNTPLPCSASKVFYKVVENQNNVKVDAYQGESRFLDQNQCLGHFVLEDLKDSGGEEVHIKFQLDRSGRLHVACTDVSTGKHASKTLKKQASSHVKHTQLADITSVRLRSDPLLEEENESQKSFQDILPLLPNFQTSISLDTPDAMVKAEELLKEGRLDPLDKEELNSELKLAKEGDPEALKRLNDLVYYLD